ncbi:MAG: hypothetical protein ACYCSR_16535, partial [Thiomonas sp.]
GIMVGQEVLFDGDAPELVDELANLTKDAVEVGKPQYALTLAAIAFIGLRRELLHIKPSHNPLLSRTRNPTHRPDHKSRACGSIELSVNGDIITGLPEPSKRR